MSVEEEEVRVQNPSSTKGSKIELKVQTHASGSSGIKAKVYLNRMIDICWSYSVHFWFIVKRINTELGEQQAESGCRYQLYETFQVEHWLSEFTLPAPNIISFFLGAGKIYIL